MVGGRWRAVSFTRYLLLPELRLLETRAFGKDGLGGTELLAEKVSTMEVCPRCATPSESVYDRRWVRLKDEPLRLRQTILSVHKRRFWCRLCKKPFTEPLPGVRKGYRTTERYDVGCFGLESTSSI